MKDTRRTKSIHGDGSSALTPASAVDLPEEPRQRRVSCATGNPSELEWTKRLLTLERRRHGSVETVLTASIRQLQTEVAFLRGIIAEGVGQQPITISPLNRPAHKGDFTK